MSEVEEHFMSENCIYFEFSEVSDLEKHLNSRFIKYGYDIFQIEEVVKYVTTTFKGGKQYKGRVILEMSKKEKTMKVVTQTNLVFDDSDEERSSPNSNGDLNFAETEISLDEPLPDLSSEEVTLEDNCSKYEDEEEDLIYPDTYYLPILFVEDKSGSERMWKIWVVGDTVHRIQGLIKGKKQPYQRTHKGKNIGKRNETTSEEQAKQSAETTWIKQLDKGYLPKCNEGKAMLRRVKSATSSTGGHNINAGASIRGRKEKTVSKKRNSFAVDGIQTFIKPMKAGKWEISDKNNPKSVLPKVIKYFDFEEKGVYMQAKLDGWRCIARVQNTPTGPKCVLTTNNGKQFKWFGKLREEIIQFLKGKEKLALDGLDGELYSHRLVDKNRVGLDDSARFSTISSICGVARSEPHELEDQINLVVFDLVDLTGKLTQDQRFSNLKKLFSNQPPHTSHVQMCDTKVANFLEDVIDYHDEVAQQGYEGVILRTRDLKYTDKRSLEMRKYKHFNDREYPIVDVEKDEGVDDEYFVWVLMDPDTIDSSTKQPKRFKAKPTGSSEDRYYWYQNYLEYLGKPMTVKFQEYSEDGIPRFPIALGIREDQ